MAGKFIELKQVAEMLGVTPDELNEMREAGDIHGYRDGSSWKFKEQEVQRVIAERKSAAHESDADSILVSEEELGGSGEGTPSTVIGKDESGEDVLDEDNDIQLITDGDSAISEIQGSDVELLSEESSPSNVDLDLQESSASGFDSELVLASESSIDDFASGKGASGKGASGKEGESQKDDQFESSDLSLDDDFDIGDSEELSLGEEDDELAVGGSGAGSDVTLDTGDSGINLASPSDSGLSIEEEPAELSGSGVDSFELPEDEEMVDLSEIASAEGAVEMIADEEFLLSPSGSAVDESDSGSQVIAIEESDAFDEEAATMLGASAEPLLVEDPADSSGGMLEDITDSSMATAPASAAAAFAEPEEAPYSMPVVIGLGALVLFLGLTGIVMMDVVRNMWAFDKPFSATSSITDLFLSWLRL